MFSSGLKLPAFRRQILLYDYSSRVRLNVNLQEPALSLLALLRSHDRGPLFRSLLAGLMSFVGGQGTAALKSTR